MQVRRTGDSGWRGISGCPGTPEWWAGVGFILALVAAVLGPVTAMLGLDRVDTVTNTRLQAVATVVAVVGIVGTFLTQVAMGSNWRIGVDETETTDLVAHGPFAVVRNLIFTAMAVTGAGLAFVVANVVALTRSPYCWWRSPAAGTGGGGTVFATNAWCLTPGPSGGREFLSRLGRQRQSMKAGA